MTTQLRQIETSIVFRSRAKAVAIEKYSVLPTQILECSVYIRVFASIDEALEVLVEFWQYMQILFVVFAGVSLILSYFVAKGITSPLQLLLSNAQKLESGDFSTKIKIERKDEIGDLAHAFKSTQLAIFEREKKA